MFYLNRKILLFILCSLALWQNQFVWAYEYYDNFNSDKAINDSVAHCVQWPETAYPPAQPYLFYNTYLTDSPRTLVFMGHKNIPADILYRFPLKPDDTDHKTIKGSITFDVEFPFENYVNTSLKCRLSSTGHIWSVPIDLETGYNRVPVFSLTGQLFVQFIGQGASIDNLSVNFISDTADIIVPYHFDTIQEAIDNAVTGQIIEVLPGVYTGEGNCDIDFLGKAISLRSANGPEETIINCQNSHRAFYFHNGENNNSIIQGFTIINGYVSGIETADADIPWVKSSSHSVGGSIYCEFSSPIISKCKIINSQAHIGGAIGVVGGGPVIYDCEIQNCVAGNSDLAQYKAMGGAIAMFHNNKTQIIKCIIKNNKCNGNSMGAGIYCYKSSPAIFETIISGNFASGNLTGAGLCFEDSGNVLIKQCLVYQNIAQGGSGIYVNGKRSDTDVFEITNCTIADNDCKPISDPNACAVVEISDASVKISNSIIWNKDNNQIKFDNIANIAPVQYCNVKGGFAGLYNIDVDPLFANIGSAVNPDYHLQSTAGRYNPRSQQWVSDSSHSPCIDAGIPYKLTAAEPWPSGRRINIGAYGQSFQASKSIRYRLLHVDGFLGGDSNEGYIRQSAFKTIVQAVNVAVDTNVILVWPGVYPETIDPLGKKILIQSASVPAVIQPLNGYGLVCHNAETRETVIRNMIFRDCFWAVSCVHTSPTLSNLTIVNNRTGMVVQGDSQPLIANTIFSGNDSGDFFCDQASGCEMIYSRYDKDNIQLPSMDSGRVILHDNISGPAFFGAEDDNSFYLASKFGRFTGFNDPNSVSSYPVQWVSDNITSPCVDAGQPDINPIRETMPNGGRLNMGACGGTIFASRSLWLLKGDNDYDGIVDLHDFANISNCWLESQSLNSADVNLDGDIDFGDIIIFAENWLGTLPWALNPNINVLD
ncbi:MAG: hypothetical protein JEZ07_06075 [Phycisphaerae bacterium]|nr:hypothetical protein [Phycisphaerae bacterium]